MTRFVDKDAENSALEVMRRYTEAHNNLDTEAFVETFNFPLFDMSGKNGTISVTAATKEELIGQMPDMVKDLENQGRAYSTFQRMEAVQSNSEKVHILCEFSRHHSDGFVYLQGELIYIVTKVNEHWGVQFRSAMITLHE